MNKTYYERNLPHWQPEGKAIFLTWRLFGSLPAVLIEKHRHLRIVGSGKAFAEIDRHLDRARTGPKWLFRPEVASLVMTVLHRGDHDLHLFQLFAFVVMPNHVHVLIQPRAPLAKITQGIKGSTARMANALLHRRGEPFWQDESFDHWVRTPREFARIRQYIEWNPVRAGLATKPEAWPWSSASSTGFQPVPLGIW